MLALPPRDHDNLRCPCLARSDYACEPALTGAPYHDRVAHARMRFVVRPANSRRHRLVERGEFGRDIARDLVQRGVRVEVHVLGHSPHSEGGIWVGTKPHATIFVPGRPTRHRRKFPWMQSRQWPHPNPGSTATRSPFLRPHRRAASAPISSITPTGSCPGTIGNWRPMPLSLPSYWSTSLPHIPHASTRIRASSSRTRGNSNSWIS